MENPAYQIQQDKRVLVARPTRGECTGKDIAELVVALRDWIDTGEADSVVIDLCNVKHMDSCCISRLLVLRQHAVKAGGSVALAGCQGNLQFLFKMTRLDRAFGIYDSTNQAAQELRDRRSRITPPAANHTEPETRPAHKHGFAPLLTALLRAHQRKQARQSQNRPAQRIRA